MDTNDVTGNTGTSQRGHDPEGHRHHACHDPRTQRRAAGDEECGTREWGCLPAANPCFPKAPPHPRTHGSPSALLRMEGALRTLTIDRCTYPCVVKVERTSKTMGEILFVWQHGTPMLERSLALSRFPPAAPFVRGGKAPSISRLRETRVARQSIRGSGFVQSCERYPCQSSIHQT